METIGSVLFWNTIQQYPTLYMSFIDQTQGETFYDTNGITSGLGLVTVDPGDYGAKEGDTIQVGLNMYNSDHDCYIPIGHLSTAFTYSSLSQSYFLLQPQQVLFITGTVLSS